MLKTDKGSADFDEEMARTGALGGMDSAPPAFIGLTALVVAYLVVFVIYLAGPLPKAGAIIAELIVMGCYLFALLVALPGLQKRPEAPPGVVLRQMESDGV